ncbi:MAG TPA: condensation domain-containing protein, partial [Pyrinomonadaceae bacterium]|nr:condensation domain-containing protein [Pyrinomonadaceae bacterium]
PSGALTYEGRRDGQIKIRGYRIELGDIETALSAEPDVQECAIAVKEKEGEKRLVAYVVLRPEARAQGWELRARLKECLPEHMLPAAIVELESLPLTSSGKIDRRALPEPDESRPEQEASFTEPRNETEARLAEVWRELLGLTRIGVLDNFFEAGGDSLLATQLIARVNKHFNAAIPLRALFDQPTIAELARNIEASGEQEQEAAIEPVSRTENPPLSYAQERLWFMNQLQPHSPLFNIATAVHLRGELQREALEQTFIEIVRRHETLRTVFEIVDDVPVQIILEPQPFAMSFRDLSALSEAEQQTEVLAQVQKEAQQPFDLTKLPLLRLSLLKLNDEEHVLVLIMHH